MVPVTLPPHRRPAAAPDDGGQLLAEPAPPTGGLGQTLTDLLAELGQVKAGGCGCADKAAALDRHGPEWARQNRETVEGWLREAAAKAGWAAHVRGAAKAVTTGLIGRLGVVDPVGRVLDEALRRHGLSAEREAAAVPVSRRVVGGLRPGAFNGGESVVAGRRLLAYRVGQVGARVYVAELDAAGAVVRDVPLAITHPLAAGGQDDPVVTEFRGRPRVWFVGCEPGHRRGRMMYADLSPDLEVTQAYHVEPPGRQRAFEKNWIPFEHAGEQYAVYSISPHVVVKIDGGRVAEVHRSPYPFKWSGGHLRGGSAAVRVGDVYAAVTHGKIEPRRPLLYNAGVYAIEAKPPFRPVAAAADPILWGDDAEAARLGCEFSVVFPRGLVVAGDRWRITGGEYECRVAGWEYAAADMMRLLGQ